VIRYNATDTPFKQAIFSQNKYPNSKWRYAQIANYLNLGGDTDDEKVELLIAAIEDLKRQVDIPATIKDALLEQGTGEEFFMTHVEEMADHAFDDQCTGANPRYPLIADLKELMVKAYG
jgi:acetaldehyde dehydrogenase/alcohol dehydrogenase